MIKAKFELNVTSEIGQLEGVILHTPGLELENMTPMNAKRALYSDILNLAIANDEYLQFKGVLDKVTKTFQVKDLLKDILSNDKVKHNLITKICKNEGILNIQEELLSLNRDELARQIFEGVVIKVDNLSKFLSKERYSLQPLHNFFYTRDAAITIGHNVLIGNMANRVREREALIMEAIFDYHPFFNTKTISSLRKKDLDPAITIEGGDILVAREDVLLIGIGARTTTQGVDFIIDHFKEMNEKMHIIVQELPHEPESFIHLDMVFTFLDYDKCMIYEPVIKKYNKYQTVHIYIEDGKVVKIKEEENLISALKKLGIDLNPITCGANEDEWTQQREQWHSGANFFAFAPGKVIGYGRNLNTIDELNKNGFEVIKAIDVINNNVDLDTINRAVVTIEGAELPRGGGGARCMTMPVKRQNVNW